jgi:hypothetical protein
MNAQVLLILIVHARLLQATETDRSRVEGSLQPHSIDTRTLVAQCSALDSAGNCWVCEGREDTGKNG